MKVIKGDLIELALNGHFDVIVHGCNCYCCMGAGIAKQIEEQFPNAAMVDHKTKIADVTKLGTNSYSIEKNKNNKDFVIVNAYTQFGYGSGLQVDYKALRSCFKKVKENCTGKRIGYPLIGAGLAGGDWEIIKTIIKEELVNENHTLVIWTRP
jgi:O-acetyl-ADP-ribose deacetylase (regulator of RNase III)